MIKNHGTDQFIIYPFHLLLLCCVINNINTLFFGTCNKYFTFFKCIDTFFSCYLDQNTNYSKSKSDRLEILLYVILRFSVHLDS